MLPGPQNRAGQPTSRAEPCWPTRRKVTVACEACRKRRVSGAKPDRKPRQRAYYLSVLRLTYAPSPLLRLNAQAYYRATFAWITRDNARSTRQIEHGEDLDLGRARRLRHRLHAVSYRHPRKELMSNQYLLHLPSSLKRTRKAWQRTRRKMTRSEKEEEEEEEGRRSPRSSLSSKRSCLPANVQILGTYERCRRLDLRGSF